MSQEQINMNITLDKTTPVLCDKCGNQTFKEVVILRKASRFITGTSQDALIPIPIFACAVCNSVNDEFFPSQLKQDVQ